MNNENNLKRKYGTKKKVNFSFDTIFRYVRRYRRFPLRP